MCGAAVKREPASRAAPAHRSAPHGRHEADAIAEDSRDPAPVDGAATAGSRSRRGRRSPTSPARRRVPGAGLDRLPRRRRRVGGDAPTVLDAAADWLRPIRWPGPGPSRTRDLGVLFPCAGPSRSSWSSTCTRVRRARYHLLLGVSPPAGPGRLVDELRYRCEGLIAVGPDLHGRDLEPLLERSPSSRSAEG